MAYLIVFVGAGIGGALRHAVNVLAGRLFGLDFLYGTVVANILGSLLMGVFVGLFAFKVHADQTMRLFLTTGLLGGFTTFSAFSLDTIVLYERGRIASALGYAAGSVGMSVGALALGLWIIRRLV